jgi:hypothetical protein
MWCCICNLDLSECICPDIEERLASLAGTPATPAAAINIVRRMVAQNKDRKVVLSLLPKRKKHVKKQNDGLSLLKKVFS